MSCTFAIVLGQRGPITPPKTWQKSHLNALKTLFLTHNKTTTLYQREDISVLTREFLTLSLPGPMNLVSKTLATFWDSFFYTRGMWHKEPARCIQDSSLAEAAACMVHNCPWRSWRSRCPKNLPKMYHAWSWQGLGKHLSSTRLCWDDHNNSVRNTPWGYRCIKIGTSGENCLGFWAPYLGRGLEVQGQQKGGSRNHKWDSKTRKSWRYLSRSSAPSHHSLNRSNNPNTLFFPYHACQTYLYYQEDRWEQVVSTAVLVHVVF